MHTHNDGDGQPVPSRAAARSELELLAAAVAEHDGTTVELIVPGCLNGFTEDDIDLMSTHLAAVRTARSTGTCSVSRP